MRVDFYVQQGAGAEGLARLACRLLEKAWIAGQTACVYDPHADSLETLDRLLWTFSDGSFVPHERLVSGTAAVQAPPEAPIVLTLARPPADLPRALLLNRASTVPEFATEFERVIELVDDEPARREAGRARFRAYRQLGCEPQTHTLPSPLAD